MNDTLWKLILTDKTMKQITWREVCVCQLVIEMLYLMENNT